MNVHRYYPAPHQKYTKYLCASHYSRTYILSQNYSPSRHITNSIPDLIQDDLVSFVEHHLFQLRYGLPSSSLNSLLENV